LRALVVIPEAFYRVSEDGGVAKSGSVVVYEGELVWWKNVRRGMGVEFGPNFCQSLLEKLSEALIDTAVTVLCDVDGLAERDLTVAG
jgi:hypothetical protein